jgi:hypothetical protein
LPRMARATTKTKKAPVEEIEDLEEDVEEEEDDVEEVDDDDLLLDEDDDDDMEEIVKPTPKKKTAKKKKSRASSEVTFGVRDLCDWLTAHNEDGKVYQPKDLRNLIRRMAREDNPRVDREVIPGNKARYDWPQGIKDPEVKRIIKAVQKGEIEQARKEQLDSLKERKAAKDAAAGKGKKTRTKAAKGKSVDVLEDEDEDEDFEDEDEE